MDEIFPEDEFEDDADDADQVQAFQSTLDTDWKVSCKGLCPEQAASFSAQRLSGPWQQYTSMTQAPSSSCTQAGILLHVRASTELSQ